jgi:MoxR-like ATPase
MNEAIEQVSREVEKESLFLKKVTEEIAKVVVGQNDLIQKILIALISNGHILIEGVPGLAKTLTVSTMAKIMQISFNRIQFTPDLLPADLIGTLVFNPKTGEFSIKKGPIFTNVVLADEINRAPSKVQSALLEAMQEKQVTIGDTTYPLEEPFIVLATQNPIEQEGTYPLPEAQVDRFMLKVKVDYPSMDEERLIMDRMSVTKYVAMVEKVVTPTDIIRMRDTVDKIYIDDKIKDYIVNIVFATREPSRFGINGLDGLIEYGASPRASIYLSLASKSHAFIQGRGYVTPHDVKSIGYDVLRHRVIPSYEAEAEEILSEDILKDIFDNVKVP